MRIGAAILIALAIAMAALAAPTNLVQNGSFETNGGPNSNLPHGWTIVDEQSGSGTWLAQSGKTGPVTPDLNCGTADVEPPLDGAFAAMSTQSSQGSHVLYQDVAIPRSSGAARSTSAAPVFTSMHRRISSFEKVDVVPARRRIFRASMPQCSRDSQVGPEPRPGSAARRGA